MSDLVLARNFCRCHEQESDCCGTLCKRLIAEIKVENLTLTMNKVMEK